MQQTVNNFSIPFGLVTILALTNFWPHEEAADLLSWTAFKSIDFIGSVTLLCSSGFLVFALQQAGSQTFAWDSPQIIVSFVIAVISLGIFTGWETHLARKKYRHIEPIFPIRLMGKRVYAAGLL